MTSPSPVIFLACTLLAPARAAARSQGGREEAEESPSPGVGLFMQSTSLCRERWSRGGGRPTEAGTAHRGWMRTGSGTHWALSLPTDSSTCTNFCLRAAPQGQILAACKAWLGSQALAGLWRCSVTRPHAQLLPGQPRKLRARPPWGEAASTVAESYLCFSPKNSAQ